MWSIEGIVAPLLFTMLGISIGSFLNVVIHRLPKMMERQWRAEAEAFVASSVSAPESSDDRSQTEAGNHQPFNLVTPRSRCPHCGHQIAWYENVPVISWVLLRGKCSECRAPISSRYPGVELLTGALFAFCGAKWGIGIEALAWCGFSAALVALTFIDWDTTLLPDDITLPLLWAGLTLSGLQVTDVQLNHSVFGAIAGYLSLWTIYWAFKLATGKEGMGYGDFKLFAALGAWFGWQALLPIILIASIIGAFVGIAIKFADRLREGGYVPFGPFLALGGVGAMIISPEVLLSWLGM